MTAPSCEEKVGSPIFILALLWGLLVLVRFTYPSLSDLQAWGTLFNLGPSTPDAPGGAAALAHHLQVVLTTLGILCVTGVLGRHLRTWAGLDLPEVWVRAALDLVLGTIFLGSFWIGLGLCGLWFPLLGKVLGIPLLAWCLFDLGRGPWKGRTFKVPVPREPGLVFLSLTGLLFFGFALLQDLAPETFYDSMVYHLAVPSRWLSQHGIVDYPANFFSNYPYGAETFFLNGLIFQGTETAKMLHLAAFGACTLLAGGWAREVAGERAGWLTLGMAQTFPLMAFCVWTTQVEGFLALACLAFLYCVDRWTREGGGAWALLTGLCAGLALAAKYTALPLLLAASLVLVLQRLGPLLGRKKGEWAWVLGGSFLTLGPWVMKNLAFTGNPFFPYLMGFFPGRRIPFESYLKLLEEQRVRVASDLLGLLKLPWTLTMANPDAYIFVGPLALGLSPLLLLFRYRNPSLRFLAALLPVLFLIGLSLTHILKFSMPAFLVLYLVLGAAVGGSRFPFLWRSCAWGAGVTALACFTYLASISHFHYDSAGFWAGRTGRDSYLQGDKRIAPYQEAARWVAMNLPPDDQVLVVGGSRGLYLERPFLNQSVFDEQVLRRVTRASTDPEGILRALRQEGVEDLLVEVEEGLNVSNYHHYDLTSKEWERLEGFMQRGTDLLYLKDLKGLYRLRKGLGPPRRSGSPNLVLFLSEPAANFVKAAQRNRREEAERELKKVLELFPFSEEWKAQARLFRQVARQTP